MMEVKDNPLPASRMSPGVPARALFRRLRRIRSGLQSDAQPVLWRESWGHIRPSSARLISACGCS